VSDLQELYQSIILDTTAAEELRPLEGRRGVPRGATRSVATK